MRKILLVLLIIPVLSNAQILKPSKWSFSFSNESPKAGDEVELIMEVKIDDGWYLYSSDFDPDLGPMVTEVVFEEHPSFEVLGKLEPVGASKKYDEIWEGDVTYFKETGKFIQKIKVLDENYQINGEVAFQVCTEIDGKCIPGDAQFTFPASRVKTEKVIETGEKINLEETNQEGSQGGSFWAILLSGFVWGLLAVATPCIYPLIPITVSIFLKQSSNRQEGLTKAFVYGASIILLFVVIGFLVSFFWGVSALNELSTHWLFNIILFTLFVVFSLSLFGVFEIKLPSGMVNAIDRQADRGGYIGIFFMATTLVVVSFSCTVPLVSTALFQALNNGKIFDGVTAMLGFSLAFALPFTGFALFPRVLNSLPKSGGWLNAVKIILGFLELAFALKFLSVADLAYHWGILDRHVFISIWIVIFSMIGFYLIGKLKFSGDTDSEKLSIPRVILAIFTFSFVIYLIPGLMGAPLKPLAGFLPPMYTHDFNLMKTTGGASPELVSDINEKCETPKYGDILHAPHGIPAYFDYDQALACARASKKPLFIDFTGHGCVNCREMEARVWSDPGVLKRLKNDFVVVELYVDDRTVLPESEWFESKVDGKLKKTIGKKNADLQISKYNQNAQPFYVILGKNENILVPPKAYDLNIANFTTFLDSAIEAYKKNNPPKIGFSYTH